MCSLRAGGQRPCGAHTHPWARPPLHPQERPLCLSHQRRLAALLPALLPGRGALGRGLEGSTSSPRSAVWWVAWRLLLPPLWRSSCLLHALLVFLLLWLPPNRVRLGQVGLRASVSATLRRRTRNSPAGRLLGQALGVGGITTFLCAFYSIFLLNFCFDFYLVFLFFHIINYFPSAVFLLLRLLGYSF